MAQTALYGSNIEPSCEYCSNNKTPGDTPTCTAHCVMEQAGNCKKFNYDPLMRTPKPKPPLRRFSKEDFAL